MKCILLLIVALAIAVALVPSAAATAGANRRLLQDDGQGSGATINNWNKGRTYPDLFLSKGSSVTFKWKNGNPGHGVARLSSGGCPSDNQGVKIVAAVSKDGFYTTPPLGRGTYWYSCPVPGHCQSGQIIKIVVS